MGESSDQCRERQQSESPEIAEGKFSADQPLLNGGWQQPDDGIAGAAMKEPQYGKRRGQSANEQSGKVVKVPALRGEAEEVFEIRRHGADNDGREDQPGFPEGKRCGRVRERKRHAAIIEENSPRSQPGGLFFLSVSKRTFENGR